MHSKTLPIKIFLIYIWLALLVTGGVYYVFPANLFYNAIMLFVIGNLSGLAICQHSRLMRTRNAENNPDLLLKPAELFSEKYSKYQWIGIIALLLCDALGMVILQKPLGISMIPPLFYLVGNVSAASLCHVFYPVCINQKFRLIVKPNQENRNELFLMQMLAQMAFGCIALVMFNYLGAWLNFPLIDQLLLNGDHYIGLDWLGYIQWVNNHPHIALLFTIFYQSLAIEVIVIIILLYLLQKLASLQRLIAEMLLGGFITITISILLPGLSVYDYYHILPETYPHLQVYAAKLPLVDLMQMRNHIGIAPNEPLKGIVAFPSFHTTLAILALHALWFLRRLWVRLPLILLNSMVIVATPVDGGHYFMDVLGGLFIAWVTIYLVRLLIPKPNAQNIS